MKISKKKIFLIFIYRYTTINTKSFDDLNVKGFSINICNDTVISCKDKTSNGTNSFLMYNSTAIYRSNTSCVRVANKFFNDENYLELTQKRDGKNLEKFVIKSEGDKCNSTHNFTLSYLFSDPGSGREAVNYDKMDIPDRFMTEECDRKLEITVKYESITDRLLIQKFFSNYHIATGIIFFGVGLFLMVFAKQKKPTKFLLGIIFGEIFIFTFFVGMIGIYYKYMEWAFFITGLAIGGFLGYFMLGGSRLYRVILALDCGFIFGLIFFDVFFTHLCTRLSQILLCDTLLIFMSLFLVIICLEHSFHFFFNSIIGSYIFIRGICCLIKDAGKYAGFRELNLLLYLIGKNETELAIYYYDNYWPIYYLYTILMFVFMAGSIVYYFFNAYKKDEDYLKEIDEKSQKQLLKDQSTAVDEDK